MTILELNLAVAKLVSSCLILLKKKDVWGVLCVPHGSCHHASIVRDDSWVYAPHLDPKPANETPSSGRRGGKLRHSLKYFRIHE